MNVDERHRHAVGLDDVEQEHHAVTDLELCNLVVLQHILQLVGRQRPDAVGIFQTVLRDDLGV